MKRTFTQWMIALALLCPLLGQAQTQQVSGAVYSKSTGLPLPGVTVRIDNKNTGAVVSGHDGQFTVTIAPGGVLTFSYVGYITQQVYADSANQQLKVFLLPSDKSLDAVVVTALGISKQRKSLGYATQELKSNDISEAKETNIVNAFAGKVAGVRTTNTQGDMGSARIVIRGETSISGNNQPLFIIDGIPVDNTQLGAGSSRDYRNPISDINAEDIETISVLKGPNAAALYGSRAAHGVILIKTKSGASKKGIGVTINSNTTFSSLLILPDYQNVFGQGAEGKFSYVDGKGGGVNDGVDESWGPKMNGQLIPQFYSKGEPVPFLPHPDNVKDYFKTGVTASNSVALDGAGQNYNYRISFNNEKQLGVIPNSEAAKNNVAFNAQFTVTPKLKIGVTANYIVYDADNVPGSAGRRATSTMLQYTWFGRQVDIDKLRDYKDVNGNTFNWNNSYYSNPFWIAYENTVSQRRNRFIGSAFLDYEILNGLHFNFRSGNDYYNDRRKLRIAYGTNGTPFGSYQETGYTVNENNTEFTLRYNKNLDSDFSLDVLGGGNIRNLFSEENDQQAPRLAVAGLYTLANSRDPLISSNTYSKQRVNSAFASAQIGFRNYAFLNLTGRNDWSSTLARANIAYFYPSVNASFVLTEAFNIKSALLNYARVRAGWSRVGHDAEPYKLKNVFNFNAPFNSNPQLTSSGTDNNPNLQNETTNSTEIGFEAGLWSNRIRLDVSLYNTNSIDQILNVNVSPTTGYNQQVRNTGIINNKGLEVQLGVTPLKIGAFQWDVDVNYAINRSRVIELDKEGDLQNFVIGSYRNIQVIAGVGKPYGTLFGNAYLRDAKGNVVVNNAGIPQADQNKKVLGKFTPDWIGGINNSFSYKNFNLSFLVDASIGGSLFAGTNSTGSYTGVLAITLPGRDAEHGGLNYYYPNNDKSKGTTALANGANAPAGETVYEDGMIWNGVTTAGAPNAKIIPASQFYKAGRSIEEQFVYSASYVKFRELKLGYTLPISIIRKIGLVGATISLVGRNLWIIDKDVPNIDPENAFNTGNGQGLEDMSLPTVRSYGFNINLKF